MRPVLKRLASACAGAMLLACATSPERTPLPMEGGSTAERNRHATELAEKADYAGAIAVWRELTAATSGHPEAAYLFRNLGYALFLNGEYDAALAALEKACLLDPLNARGWQHLGSALRKLGQEQRATLMFRQAETLQRHEFTADYALARGSTVPAIVSAVSAPPRTTQEWATRKLDAASGVVDLSPATDSVPATQPLAAVAPDAPQEVAGSAAAQPSDAMAGASTSPVDMPQTAASGEAPVRVEVRNGNGVRGMAARTARRIASDSLKVVRLTNEKGFGVEYTRIEYESGFKDAASQLAARFGAATMVEVKNCWKTDMRLVLGRDQKEDRLAATRPTPRKL